MNRTLKRKVEKVNTASDRIEPVGNVQHNTISALKDAVDKLTKTSKIRTVKRKSKVEWVPKG